MAASGTEAVVNLIGRPVNRVSAKHTALKAQHSVFMIGLGLFRDRSFDQIRAKSNFYRFIN